MSENLKTIKELADELGVSKQRIQQIISKLPSDKSPSKQGNKYILNDKDTNNIKSILGKTANQQTTNQQTANQQTTNQQTANQQTTNQQTANQQTANQQTTNQQTANQQTANQQTTNQQTTNQQTTNQQTANQQTTNQQTTNQQTTNRTVDYDIYLDVINSSKEKDKQIEKLTNILDQQQRLALQDKKLLEEYKSEINDLKTLKMPSHDREEQEVDNRIQEELQRLKNENEALQEQLNEKEPIEEKEVPKKWWQIWK